MAETYPCAADAKVTAKKSFWAKVHFGQTGAANIEPSAAKNLAWTLLAATALQISSLGRSGGLFSPHDSSVRIDMLTSASVSPLSASSENS